MKNKQLRFLTHVFLFGAILTVLSACAPSSAPPEPVPGTLALSATTYSVAESGVTATITVSRTGGSDGVVSVDYATSDGTATAGSDYTAASGTLSWADGDSADKTFTISITDDSSTESDETVSITLSNVSGGASLVSDSATLTITDNDGPGTISISLSGLLAASREDTSWAADNIDTYTLYAYNADGVLTADADATDTTISVEAEAGSYKVVLLAGDKIQVDEAVLLAAGEKASVQVAAETTTTVSLTLDVVDFAVSELSKAEINRGFHVVANGNLPLESLRFSTSPQVSLGSGSAVDMSTTFSGSEWTAQTQLTAPAAAQMLNLGYLGGNLALNDSVLTNQVLNLSDYTWKLFAGTTSPYTTSASQSVSFEAFTTVCASGCDFTTIQAAVDNASSGDNIAVRPGSYSENLLIDKSLTLYGATWDLPKEDDYPVPANYAWDTSEESLIVAPDSNANGITVDISNEGKASFAGNVTFKGFVVHSLVTETSNRHLLRVYAHDADLDNIEVSNSIIGPNTNSTNPSTYGRMGLYLVPYYGNFAITNSLFSHNKIFGSGGNGNNIFVWGSYKGHPIADLTGTVVEYNDIYGSRRSGIELSGGMKNLTIRYNRIHDNGFAGDDASGTDYKYGNGVVLIRIASESSDPDAPGIDNITIVGNQIYNNKQFGLYMGPKNTNHTISSNDIYNNAWDAIQVDLVETYHGGTNPLYGITSNISFTANNVYGNGFGARIVGSPTNGFMLNATNNWWGAASGPGPVGAGDAISANVNSSSYRDEELN